MSFYLNPKARRPRKGSPHCHHCLQPFHEKADLGQHLIDKHGDVVSAATLAREIAPDNPSEAHP